MRNKHLDLTLLALACGLSACASNAPQTDAAMSDALPLDTLQIPARFDTREITAGSMHDEVMKCLPTESPDNRIPDEVLNAFPAKGKTFGFSAPGSASRYIVSENLGFCLRFSSAGHPVFATEAFQKTITPDGVSTTTVDQWNARIAGYIARQGSARVAYLFANGNGMFAQYWVEESAPYTLKYKTSFQKPEALTKEKFDVVFSDAGLKSVTSHGSNLNSEADKSVLSKPDPLSHRRAGK